MTNFIPIMPLSIVVFPGQQLNLHVKGAANAQLIRDAAGQAKDFGILPLINDRRMDFGCTVSVQAIERAYEDGSLDVKLGGRQVFRNLENIDSLPEKLYNGAIVNYPATRFLGSPALMKKVLSGIRELLATMGVQHRFAKPDEELLSFDVAHKAGMPVDEEYVLLELEQELHRQEYIKRYLDKVLPMARQFAAVNKKLSMNGHFRNEDGSVSSERNPHT